MSVTPCVDKKRSLRTPVAAESLARIHQVSDNLGYSELFNQKITVQVKVMKSGPHNSTIRPAQLPAWLEKWSPKLVITFGVCQTLRLTEPPSTARPGTNMAKRPGLRRSSTRPPPCWLAMNQTARESSNRLLTWCRSQAVFLPLEKSWAAGLLIIERY